MRASEMLTAMPRSITVKHGTTEVTLRLHGDADVMKDGTIVRHWVDDTESVGMVLFVTNDQGDYAPTRTMMIAALGGPIPLDVATAVSQAFMPDEGTVILGLPDKLGWVVRGDQMLRTMGHRVGTPH